MTTAATDAGLLRAFFGPPRSRRESLVGTVSSALVLALLATYVWHAGGWRGWSALQIVVVAVMLFDLAFGIFTISSVTAKRWYHRCGTSVRRFRLAFVIAHVPLYLVPFAALFDTGWPWAVANAGLLLGAGIAIEFAPSELKWPVALCLTLTVGLVNLIWLPLPASLAWLSLLLAVKILLCFLVPETPTATAGPTNATRDPSTSARRR